MRIPIRFKNARDRARASSVLCENDSIVLVKPDIVFVREDQLRLLKGKNGRKKYEYEVLDSKEFMIG
ncbi:MAG: hypothetical protein FJ279_34340 [Planctomycetes bacterium]|nr:hypothetical protein [Planctomycetota bacterium]MBM4078368.1 hypothetical protein [Planctomycetota bacterium]MBM4084622.1 hypothetical protein [Planctomycetota bacterium]